MGYYNAGFEVVGVDIRPQPRYPFTFVQEDVFRFINGGQYELHMLEFEFDAIHASPPCQAYSTLQKQNKKLYPDLIGQLRNMFSTTNLPYVIENIEGAPLIRPIMLCGTMFPHVRVIRHRLFESNVKLTQPVHVQEHPWVHTLDRRKNTYGLTDEWVDYVQITGGGNCTRAAARDAMGINWMKKQELNNALPPAYTEYIGGQLHAYV